METIQFEYLNLIAAYMLHALVESQHQEPCMFVFVCIFEHIQTT